MVIQVVGVRQNLFHGHDIIGTMALADDREPRPDHSFLVYCDVILDVKRRWEVSCLCTELAKPAEDAAVDLEVVFGWVQPWHQLFIIVRNVLLCVEITSLNLFEQANPFYSKIIIVG